jgi:Holliday junction DNA helicase RuvA
MIAKLRGLLDHVGEEDAVVDVGGVGYLVFASRRTLERLPAAGSEVEFLIETHVREDHIHLYGFTSMAERAWFRLLLTVQGVGAKVALAILGVLSTDDLANAIAAQDKAMVGQAPGVGPKLAGRIVAELKDKAGAIGGDPVVGEIAAAAGGGAGTPSADAISALINLGYKRGEAAAAIARASQKLGEDAGVGALVTDGLKELAR